MLIDKEILWQDGIDCNGKAIQYCLVGDFKATIGETQGWHYCTIYKKNMNGNYEVFSELKETQSLGLLKRKVCKLKYFCKLEVLPMKHITHANMWWVEK